MVRRNLNDSDSVFGQRRMHPVLHSNEPWFHTGRFGFLDDPVPVANCFDCNRRAGLEPSEQVD